MDAFMAALILGALTQASDKTPWLAALLADRFKSPLTVIVGALVALATNYALGVVAGLLLTKLLTPEARLLLLALALVIAGVSTGIRQKAPDALAGWRIGRIATATLGLFIMAFGDRMQFIVAALAGRSPLPWAAAVGATLGALIVTGGAAVAGERAWRALPLRAIGIVAMVVLTGAGVILGLSAVRLI